MRFQRNLQPYHDYIIETFGGYFNYNLDSSKRANFILLTNNGITSLRWFNEYLDSLSTEEKQEIADYFIFVTIYKATWNLPLLQDTDQSMSDIKIKGYALIKSATDSDYIKNYGFYCMMHVPVNQNAYALSIEKRLDEGLEGLAAVAVDGIYATVDEFHIRGNVSLVTKNSIIVDIGTNNGAEIGQRYMLYSEGRRNAGRGIVEYVAPDYMRVALIDSTPKLSANCVAHEYWGSSRRISFDVGYIFHPMPQFYTDETKFSAGLSLQMSRYIGWRHVFNIMAYSIYSGKKPEYINTGYPIMSSPEIDKEGRNLIGGNEIYFQKTRLYLYPGIYMGFNLFAYYYLLPSITFRFRIFNWLSMQLQFSQIVPIAILDNNDKYAYPMVTLSFRFFDATPKRPLKVVK